MNPFTHNPTEAVSAAGEIRLVAHIARWLGAAGARTPEGIGDDCAVLPCLRRRALVTVDPLIYGEHFDATLSPAAAGQKLLKRNLSDIAAMGGTPRFAVIAIALDRSVRLAWVRGFYRAIAVEAKRWHVRVVGGDIAHQAGALSATLTLIGEAGSRVLTRQGARCGDHIFVTGKLGGSLPSGRHWKFTPRLAEGRWLAARREVRSMMDLSDGLAKDIRALTPPGCKAALKAAAIPRHRGCDLRAALCDGEDYELLFTLSKRADATAFQAAWRRAFPKLPLTEIGVFVPKNQPAKESGIIPLEDYHGFEHLH